MKIINLKDKLEGHVVLWTKGWYGNGHRDAYDRINDVWREWCGMPVGYEIGPKHLLRLLADTADILSIKQADVMDTFLRNVSQRNNRLSSYQVGNEDTAKVWDMVDAYAQNIACSAIKTETLTVDLPKLLPDTKYRYELKERE